MGIEELQPVRSSRWLRRTGYAVGGLATFLLFLAGAGAAYQWAAGRRDRRMNPPPGQLVDVGGYRMHVYCTGQGSPAVVLDSGLGDTWLSWHKVQPDIARFARVCSYDRAGMGWSDPSPRSRTSLVIATELHSLLRNAGIPPPFVLVGHSLGGLNMRMYAGLYKNEVTGIVLVDATPDHMDLFPPELKKYNDAFLRKEDLRQKSMPFGIPRLMGWCGTGAPELRRMLRTIDCRLQPWREHLAEYQAGEESMAEVRASGSVGEIPLIVLSHDPVSPPGPIEKGWAEGQKELLQLSTNSSRVIVKGSGHNIQIDRPDAVISAIHKAVEDSKN